MSLRIEKVNRELQKQIMDIIQREVDDPALGFLSITRVDTTADLRESKVYFSLLDETKNAQARQVLNRMKGFIRSILSKRMGMRLLPQLSFFPDDSIRYSVDIYQKIEEIKALDARKRSQEDNRKDPQE